VTGLREIHAEITGGARSQLKPPKPLKPLALPTPSFADVLLQVKTVGKANLRKTPDARSRGSSAHDPTASMASADAPLGIMEELQARLSARRTSMMGETALAAQLVAAAHLAQSDEDDDAWDDDDA